MSENNLPTEKKGEDIMESQEQQDRRITGINIPTPWGKIEIRGLSTILTLVLIVLIVLTGMQYEGRDSHIAQTQKLSEINTSLNEQSYILTLTQDQRERLNLQMPRTLRQKVRDTGGEER